MHNGAMRGTISLKQGNSYVSHLVTTEIFADR
jgi:hypothetical protein